jgi:hypothetical protein
MRAAQPSASGVLESERYVVVVDGRERCEQPVRRREALGRVRCVLDAGDASEVVIVDARTYTARACWWRQGLGWTVRDVADWLGRPEGARHAC